MALSRRQFTKEFKLAAVRRLEQGVSIAEAARALEVGPNVLQRWRRDFREVNLRHLVFHDEPGDGVEVAAEHLHAQAGAFYDGGAAAHEWLGDFEMAQRTACLVVGVINVPNGLGGFALVLWCFHRRR